MSLKGIVQENVTKLDPESSIQEAAKLMYENHVGDVVVVQKVNWAQGKPMGIITDRDIAMVLAKKGEIDPNLKVREIMSRNVIIGTMKDGIYETIRKMKENGIHRMPIVDEEDQLVGIISADDLMQLLGHEVQQLSEVIKAERVREGWTGSSPMMETGRPIQPSA